jgi:hypothetical protein
VGSSFQVFQPQYCTRVYPKVPGLSRNEIYAYNNKRSLRSNIKVMAAKLTRLTHKIVIQLHPVAENCAICSSNSRWTARKLLDTPSYAFLISAMRGTCPAYGILLDFMTLIIFGEAYRLRISPLCSLRHPPIISA